MTEIPTSGRPGSERPKILVLITLAEVGGAQTCVSQLLPGLTRDFDVVVAAYGDGPLVEAAEKAGARWVSLRHVRRSISLRDLLGLVELVRLIRRERPSVVHANSSKAGVLGRLAAAICRTPAVVFTAHGWAFKADTTLASKLYLRADRFCSRFTSAVVCVSEAGYAEGLVARTCRPGRTTVIRYAIDKGPYSHRSTRDGQRPRLVSVGRFRAPKDFDTLLEALALLKDVDFEAVIVGDGPDRDRLIELAGRLELDGRVEFAGARTDVAEILAESDCFVLSSDSEGMPLSILEAMAAGLPVVASAVGGVVEEVLDGVTGFVVPPRDPRGFAAALRQVLTDKELRERLGAMGKEVVERDFSLDGFRSAHVDLYQQLLQTGELPVRPQEDPRAVETPAPAEASVLVSSR